MTTEIILTADTYENMIAAYVAAVEPTLTSRERRAGVARSSFCGHQEQVVSGKIAEQPPVDAAPESITISSRLVAVRREDGSMVLVGRGKVRKDEEFFPASTAAEYLGINELVWLGDRQVYVTMEEAYRNGLRVQQPEVIEAVANEIGQDRVEIRIATRAAEGLDLAKFFGGKALMGTAQQKQWAEQIRAEKIKHMTPEQATMACDPTGLYTAAKFWINHRSADAAALGQLIASQKKLLERANALRAERRHDEYAAVAEEYNRVTSVLGFK